MNLQNPRRARVKREAEEEEGALALSGLRADALAPARAAAVSSGICHPACRSRSMASLPDPPLGMLSAMVVTRSRASIAKRGRGGRRVAAWRAAGRSAGGCGGFPIQ